jgi:diguanylate cyclase (GGDEF)-like protein
MATVEQLRSPAARVSPAGKDLDLPEHRPATRPVIAAANRRRRLSVATESTRAARVLWASYGLLAVLLAAYLASLLLRSPTQDLALFDGWVVGAIEVAATILCLIGATGRHRGRAVPLVLGAALMAWTAGDITQTLQALRGGSAPSPSLADTFYVAFYPLTYIALVLVMRRALTKVLPGTWLDGLIAGLGAAALCAAFAFHAVVHSVGGSPVAAAVNLAYPVGDVLLLALVVGGTALLPSMRKTQWLLLASASAINAVGDTFNLLHSSGQISHFGIVFDAIAWPASILLMSMAVWVRPGHTDPLAGAKPPGFLLPGLGAASGLALLLVDTLQRIDEFAVGLATVTLLVVGLRLALSVRGLRALTEERRRQALTDELTGLGNRRQLLNLLNAFFADQTDPRLPRRQLAFLYVDLDHFKEINDSFGHSTGDELLRQLGPRLSQSLRGSDVLVRLGGDELGVVLVDTDPTYATTVAQRLMDQLERPFDLDGVSVRVGASIGIALAPDDATDAAALMRCADVAMYRAKLERSAFQIYREGINDVGNRLHLVDELRVAVDERHFVLHYQPQVNLRTGEISSVEALIRWPHARLGMIPPLQFIALAEEAGLIHSLTELVLDMALTQCSAWWSAGRQLTVSVNISATNLLDAGFIDLVQGTLARHDLPPSALILEITETTIIGDFERCTRVIEQMRALGLAVSIDDFGAGFTSLAYLGSLAVTELKLDRTFIAGLVGEEGRDHALVQATIELGHALGLRVVAEGIEDRATLDMLARLGCDVAQGYFISRPMPPMDLEFEVDYAGARSAAAHPIGPGFVTSLPNPIVPAEVGA